MGLPEKEVSTDNPMHADQVAQAEAVAEVEEFDPQQLQQRMTELISKVELLELEKMHHARLLQDYQRQTSGRQMEAVLRSSFGGGREVARAAFR